MGAIGRTSGGWAGVFTMPALGATAAGIGALEDGIPVAD
jgi:hypothetical protein